MGAWARRRSVPRSGTEGGPELNVFKWASSSEFRVLCGLLGHLFLRGCAAPSLPATDAGLLSCCEFRAGAVGQITIPAGSGTLLNLWTRTVTNRPQDLRVVCRPCNTWSDIHQS